MKRESHRGAVSHRQTCKIQDNGELCFEHANSLQLRENDWNLRVSERHSKEGSETCPKLK